MEKDTDKRMNVLVLSNYEHGVRHMKIASEVIGDKLRLEYQKYPQSLDINTSLCIYCGAHPIGGLTHNKLKKSDLSFLVFFEPMNKVETVLQVGEMWPEIEIKRLLLISAPPKPTPSATIMQVVDLRCFKYGGKGCGNKPDCKTNHKQAVAANNRDSRLKKMFMEEVEKTLQSRTAPLDDPYIQLTD